MPVNLDSSRRRSPKPREALRSQVRETVRAAILDAAEELIALKGLHGAGLAQIAKKAGVAVGTLYNYFEDRDALVRGLFETRRATLRPKVQEAITTGAGLSFEPRLRKFMRALFEAFESHRHYVKVLFEAEHLKPVGGHQDLLTAIDEIIAVGVAEGVIAKSSSEPLSITLAGALRGVLLRKSQSGGSFVDAADPIVTLLVDGARKRARP
jgi:AcrR family transcriptional regulator